MTSLRVTRHRGRRRFACPVESDDFVGALRHPGTPPPHSEGPAACNAGLAAATTDVAFLVPTCERRGEGWLESLLGHFCDPQ